MDLLQRDGRLPGQVMAPANSADVVIVGGGLSGLWLAHRLADEAEVLLLDPLTPASQREAAAPRLEVAAIGSVDNLAQLHSALGPSRANSLWSWSERALTALRSLHTELKVAQVCGRVLGLPAMSRNGNNFSSRQPSAVPGLWMEKASTPRWWSSAAPKSFAASVLQATFRVRLNSAPTSWPIGTRSSQDWRKRLKGRARFAALRAQVDRCEVDGVRLRADDGSQVRGELVVLAGGAESASAHPWLEKVIVPVRLHDSARPGGTRPGRCQSAEHLLVIASKPGPGGIRGASFLWLSLGRGP